MGNGRYLVLHEVAVGPRLPRQYRRLFENR